MKECGDFRIFAGPPLAARRLFTSGRRIGPDSLCKQRPRVNFAKFAFVILAGIIISGPLRAGAQAPTATLPGAEIFTDSVIGEQTVPLGNYWDGVDADNDLHVNVMNALILNDVGQMVDTPMPSYPNFVDMNGDGLKDLVVADTQGFVWIYQNSGDKSNPRFTTGKFLPTFVGYVSKIHVCDWDGDGDNDIVVGTYYGDITVFVNYGAPKEYRFTRRMGSPRYVDPNLYKYVDDKADCLPQILMGKKPLVAGNYMAPWVCDWNKDGKPDLLLGEGTYSANSVRLYVNAGSRMKPVFSEDREFYLAYGEGFEQLTPSVVDYDGDGIDDLIVGTRTGQIRLFKGTKKAAEAKDFVAAMKGTLEPAILTCEGNLKIADREVFDVMSAPYPCDWNGDGLFDLLLGSTRGKIYIAINKGAKTEPKFPSADPVKGTDVEKDLVAPANWMPGVIRNMWDNFIAGFCNTASLLTCEKQVALKPGVFVVPAPGCGETFMYYRYVKNYPGWMQNNLAYAGSIPGVTAPNAVGGRLICPALALNNFNLRLGKKYQLSFYSIVIGRPVLWRFWSTEHTTIGTDIEPPKLEHREANGQIPPSTTWIKRSYKFTCPSTFQTNWPYHFFFRMPEGDCQFLVDGLSLKELEK